MIKIFSTAQFLSSYSLKIQNISIKRFIESKCRLNSSNIKNLSANNLGPSVCSKLLTSIDNKYLKLINSYLGQNLYELSIFHKIIVNGITFSSYLKETKRCDSCFSNLNNKSGLIECFVKINDKILVIYKQIVLVYEPFFSVSCPEIRYNLNYGTII